MSQHVQNGDINDKESELDKHLIRLFEEKDILYSIDLSQCLFYFLQLCNNGHVKLSKSTIEDTLNKCQNEKCKQMLNEYSRK